MVTTAKPKRRLGSKKRSRTEGSDEVWIPPPKRECRKLLLAELLLAPVVIEFDNLTCDLLAHRSLRSSMTSEYLNGRILDASKTATANTRSLFLSSSNNADPVQDMTRHYDPSRASL